ncbi:protein NLRC5 [Notechis scutatus]|uniref:Protein NLRC5 n=1 Tax=Notechis scutatus TaxID=8663 RepID=A0A6J1UZN8_9SAUR|nr:protein NLRC5 [Notechis scutatus]
MIKLAKILPAMEKLKTMDLSNNHLSLKSIFYLLESVNLCPNVAKLEASVDQQIAVLTFVNKGGPDATQSRNYNFHDVQLHKCQQMEVTSKKICLAGNRFQDEDLKNLCLVLRKCSNILELDLSNNSFGDSEVLKIMDSIKVLKNLNYLILDKNQMSPDGVISLLEFFSRLERITSVHLGLEGCTIGLYMTRRLLTILTKCSGLAEINFSGNSLNDQDIEQMVLCLSSLRSLRCLSIRDNVFSSNGICLLANSFNHCRRISKMDIRSRKNAFLHFVENEASEALFCRFTHCGIDQPDLRALCAVFENCDHLAELDLSGNDLDNEGLRWIFEHLPKIQNSCSLKINHNGTSPDGLLLLVNFLATKDDVVEVQASLCSEKMLLITLRKQDKPQKILSLKECNLQAEHLSQLLSGLKECTVLSNFISINNGLTLRSAKTLLKSLRRLTGVQKICIKEPWVTDESFPTFLSLAAEVQGEVITIIFSNSDLSLDSLSILLDALEGKYHLKSINFGSLNLDNTTILKLSSRVSAMPLLKKLGLNKNHFDSQMSAHLAEVLKATPQIEEIDLSYNKIDDAGMKEIARILPGMKNVKLINFSCNSITSVGGQWIAEGLVESEKLEILKLSGNRIENKTLETLAPILPFKKHLKVLHLSSCQLDSEGLGHLAGILAKCPQIEEINLSENNIGDKGVMSFMTPWPQSSQLRKIELKACDISDCASKTLIVGLSCCPFLEEIFLSWNKLGDETAKELAMVLPGLTRMKFLDLDNNCITTYGASMLARQLPRCPRIQTIRLWHNSISEDVKKQLADQEPRLHFAFL